MLELEVAVGGRAAAAGGAAVLAIHGRVSSECGERQTERLRERLSAQTAGTRECDDARARTQVCAFAKLSFCETVLMQAGLTQSASAQSPLKRRGMTRELARTGCVLGEATPHGSQLSAFAASGGSILEECAIDPKRSRPEV